MIVLTEENGAEVDLHDIVSYILKIKHILYLGEHEKDRAKDKEKHEREGREQNERERRRVGLPGRLKSDHVLR
jgi:hypothetical protein